MYTHVGCTQRTLPLIVSTQNEDDDLAYFGPAHAQTLAQNTKNVQGQTTAIDLAPADPPEWDGKNEQGLITQQSR